MGVLPPGSEIAGYRIVGVEGRGGMGVVYRAIQPGLGREIALKVIAESLLDDARVRERFLRESRAAAAIEHPHVIPIHAAGEADGVAYIAMRLVAGRDLLRVVREDGRLEPARAAKVVAAVASALHAAHGAGLVHRDVKPANILLGAGDHAYLCDFGLARVGTSTAGLTAAGGWVGSVDYIAPEQLRDEHVGPPADVYALGCVLHVALTAEVPFPRDGPEARMWAHLHAAPPRPSERAGGVPRAFDAVVARAMAKAPEDRFPTAEALGEATLAALDGVGPVARRRARRRGAAAGAAPSGAATLVDRPVPRPARGTARRRAVAGAAVAALAAAGVAAVLLDPWDGGARDGQAAPAAKQRVAARGAAGPRTGTAAVGPRPVAVAVAGGSAWVASTASKRLARVSVASLTRRRGPTVGPGASDLVARDGVLWVAAGLANSVVRLRAATGRRAAPAVPMTGQPRVIDQGEGAIWVGERFEPGTDRLVRIDPRTGRAELRATFPGRLNDLAVGLDAVWVLTDDEGRQLLFKVDPDTGDVSSQVAVGPDARDVDAGAGAVWVTNHGDNTVGRVDPRTGEVVTIGVPSKPYGISVRSDGVWVACYGDQSIVRIDPETKRPDEAVPVGVNPVGIDAGPSFVWVTNAGDDTVTRVDVR